MPIEVTRKLFTVDEYYAMAEAGILRWGERVELIDGEIIEMSPIGSRHMACVSRASRLFIIAFAGTAVVNVQQPLQLSNYTEPEPDVTVLKFRSDDYKAKKPLAEDVLLAVEVSDTTFRFDQKVKLPRYAAAGIPEVWIENLAADELLVYRDPSGGAYTTSLILHRGDSIAVQTFPDVTFQVDEILG